MEANDIAKIQSRLLEMGVIICNILTKNNIRYMLGFGTLLGAVRHKGFIPWDDDFDLQILEDDYEKAINVLKKELPKDLFLEDDSTESLYFHAWAHVKDLNTIVECKEFPQDNYYTHKGLSVDLYRIKYIMIHDLNDYTNAENIKYINRRKQKGLIKEEDYIKRIGEYKNNVAIKTNDNIKNDRMVLGFITSYKKNYFEISDVFPLKPILFCNIYFMGPANPENIVSSIYGDYMTLPPANKRRNHYTSVVFLKK